jgi:hypothetical protein
MKKIVVILIIGLALTSLHAEVTVGGGADMQIIPFQMIFNDGANETRKFGDPEQNNLIFGAGAGRHSSSQGPRARLDLRGSYNDIIGMRARIQARTDGIAIEDYLQVWWTPTSWLRIDAGRFLDDRLRGKINDLDERFNANTVRMYDADNIFTRYKSHLTGQAGLMISIAPIQNLHIGAMLYGFSPLSTSGAAGALYDAHPDYVADNADSWQRIQAALAYTIPNVGLVRAQYLGVKPQVEIRRISDEVMDDNAQLLYSYMFDTFTITAPRIEAAFAYTGLTGLTIDIGGKVPLPFKNWDRGPDSIFYKEDEEALDAIYKTYKNGFIWQAPYQASIGFRYKPGDFEIAGRVDAKFLGSVTGHRSKVYFAPEINAHIWPSYDFGFAKLIVNFGFEYIGAAYDSEKKLIGEGSPVALNGGYRMGLGLSMQKNFTPLCLFKGGFAYKFAGTVNGVKEKAVFSIPLYIDVMF